MGSCNQPVLSNEGKNSRSKKQLDDELWFGLNSHMSCL